MKKTFKFKHIKFIEMPRYLDFNGLRCYRGDDFCTVDVYLYAKYYCHYGVFVVVTFLVQDSYLIKRGNKQLVFVELSK